MANLFIDEIRKVGPLTIVQVVTDTCAVMKAAWKKVEVAFPWITCTCCAPHVLILLLHDIAKIGEVAQVLSKARKVLNRFSGVASDGAAQSCERSWPGIMGRSWAFTVLHQLASLDVSASSVACCVSKLT